MATFEMESTKKKRPTGKRLESAGFWFLFFFVLYIVIGLKVLTYKNISENFLFGPYGIIVTVYILSRFALSYFHYSPRHDDSYEPTVTFVVPAKNEEDNIAETIRRFSEANYPREKMEVIAVNDGSTDRTYEKMLEVQQELKGILPVTVVNWEVNRGKRDGMAEGIKRARNEIIIFIDSDSFIDADCVKHLVKYFADPNVGAVSGHTDVHNRNTNILTQMQAVRYYVAFTIYKAAESIFGNVTCCPGCCSAYRREYLIEFVDEWLHQTFLGAKCTFGDDRSLTNFIIRKHEAVYSPQAKAYTVVPETFGKYVKQQQRWKKSWIRETFIASTFMWKKNPIAALSFYVYIFLSIIAPIIFIRAVFWSPIATHSLPLVYFLGLFLMLLLHGIYYRAKTGRTPWFFATIVFWANSVILIWQLPWAFVTINDSRWGTR